jgi:hypothetical protein
MFPSPALSRLHKRRGMGALGACTPTTASTLPTLIYPSTVADAQARLLAALKGTDANVSACTLDPATRAAWTAFYVAASAFAIADPGLFGLGTRMDQTQTYGYQLCLWQGTLAAQCTISTPSYGSEQQPWGGPPAEHWLSAAKWIAGAVIVAGVAYLAAPAVSAWSTGRRLRAA